MNFRSFYISASVLQSPPILHLFSSPIFLFCLFCFSTWQSLKQAQPLREHLTFISVFSLITTSLSLSPNSAEHRSLLSWGLEADDGPLTHSIYLLLFLHHLVFTVFNVCCSSSQRLSLVEHLLPPEWTEVGFLDCLDVIKQPRAEV